MFHLIYNEGHGKNQYPHLSDEFASLAKACDGAYDLHKNYHTDVLAIVELDTFTGNITQRKNALQLDAVYRAIEQHSIYESDHNCSLMRSVG